MRVILNSSFPKNILLLIVTLSSPSLLITYFLIVSGINITIFRYFLLITTIIVAISGIRRYQLTYFQRRIQFTIIIILFYLLINWNTEIIFSGSPRSVFRTILLSPFIMIILNDRKFNLNKFINLFIFIAFVLASLSIIQYFGSPLGLINLKPAGILRSSQESNFIGIGGIYPNSGEIGFGGIIARNHGFFSEPTNFAQFLLVPMFLSSYKLLKNKNLLNIFIFSSIVLAFFLTFSVACFFGVITGLLVFFLVKMKNSKLKKSILNSKLVSLLIFCLLIFSLLYFYNFTNQRSDIHVLAKGTSIGFDYRMERNIIYFDRISKHPLGDINFKHVYVSNPGLIGNISLAGGYPLLLSMLFFFVYYFKIIYKQMIKSKYLLVYVGLFAYFIPALWDATFYENYFLFLFVFYSTFMKYDQMGYEII